MRLKNGFIDRSTGNHVNSAQEQVKGYVAGKMSVKGQQTSDSSVSGGTTGTGSGSGPARIGSFVVHSKSASLANGCKSTFQEQSARLSQKHSTELELIDDVRTFFKVKCSIEKDYCHSLSKLCTNHLTRKYPSFEMEKDSDIKSIYTAWQSYLEEEDKLCKFRATQFEQISNVYDNMKQIKSHKSSVGKKGIDNYLKKMQEELIASVAEIDKNRKLYFDEEHLAKQARDKEEKVKKRKGGIFSKFTYSESKKEKTSAHREASDIQSTMARNEYILALAAGNAHFEHYYTIDLPNLMQFLEDDVLDKCKGFMLNLLQSETSSLNNAFEALDSVTRTLETTSAGFTNKAFLSEPSSTCLKETLQFDFEPCDGDTVSIVSTEHNAELALQHEISKWMTCFTKECRNLHRLNQQLTKCLNLQTAGKRTVEVTGVGVVEVEARIEDIKQQLRKCDISKAKAEARLLAIKKAGMPIEDLEAIEHQIASEMKQSSLDVDVAQPLSRTPSLRSTNISEGRISSMENKSISDDQPEYNSQEPTPELNERFSSEPEPVDSPVEREPIQSYNYEAFDANANWGDYDANEAWAEAETVEETVPVTENVVETINPPAEVPQETTDDLSTTATYDQTYTSQVSTSEMVGRQVRALYPYEALNEDELQFDVDEILTILSAADDAWVTAQNDKYQVGYIPAAYVELIDDIPPNTTNGFPENNNISQENFSAVASETVSETFPTEPIFPADFPPTTTFSQEEQITQTQIEITDHVQYVRALYDYNGTSEEEISFKEGEVFKVIEKSEDGWWLAEKNGIQGHFPSMLVEDLSEEDAEAEAAFEAESPETESADSTEFPVSPSGPPPPSFAPPKPAYLTPHQVFVIQPTPEIESRGTFGSDDPEADQVNIEVNNEIESQEPSEEPVEESQNEEETSAVEIKVEFDADFSLAQPPKRSNDQGFNRTIEMRS